MSTDKLLVSSAWWRHCPMMVPSGRSARRPAPSVPTHTTPSGPCAMDVAGGFATLNLRSASVLTCCMSSLRGSMMAIPPSNVPTQMRPSRLSYKDMTASAPIDPGAWRSPRLAPNRVTLPWDETRVRPPLIVPTQRSPALERSNVITRLSDKRSLEWNTASADNVSPERGSNRNSPAPWVPIQRRPSFSSAKAMAYALEGQVGRTKPNSQLRGFQRLTPPPRVPTHSSPPRSW